MNLRCYCCGKVLHPEAPVALVALGDVERGDEFDRVFVMDPAHVGRVERCVSENVERRHCN